MKKLSILLFVCLLCLSGCGQELSRNTRFFKETKAFELAKAVEKGDLGTIETLVKKDSTLLAVTNPISGSNVLTLALYTESYEAFKALITLGANPNFINPLTKRSVLIDACKFYWKPEPYTIDLRYIDLLLQKGANPNYAIEKEEINEKGYYQLGTSTSAIHEASKLDLRMVKLLIKYGADPYKKLEQRQNPPFYEALTGFGNRIDISNYYIDSLKVNIKEPLAVFENKDTKKKNVLYIQDVVVNKFLKAKLQGNTAEMERLKSENSKIEEANQKGWEFIQKLERMGIDFKNYQYKK